MKDDTIVDRNLIHKILQSSIDALDFENVDVDIIDKLVEQIYSIIVQELDKYIVVSDNKILLPNSKVISISTTDVDGIYYDIKSVKEALSNYIKEHKKDVYYVKKKTYSLSSRKLLFIKSLVKKGLIEIKHDKKGNYSYEINNNKRVVKEVSNIKADKKDMYITEDAIKKIIRKTIENNWNTYVRKGVVTGLLVSLIIDGFIDKPGFDIQEKIREYVDNYPQTEQHMHLNTYVVQEGDTLPDISDRFGVSVEELIRINPDINPNIIMPGQRINLGDEFNETKIETPTEEEKKDVDYNKYVIKNGERKGIDISKNQEGIDLYNVIKTNNLDFCILRLDNFVWNDSSKWKDECFDSYLQDIKRLQDEGYHLDFSVFFLPDLRGFKDSSGIALTEEVVSNQVSFLLSQLEKIESNNIRFTMPIYIDVENYDSTNTKVENNELPKKVLADIAKFKQGANPEDLASFKYLKMYVDALRDKGYLPGFYSSIAGIESYQDLIKYVAIDPACLWQAAYGNDAVRSAKNLSHNMSKYPYSVQQHGQYIELEGYNEGRGAVKPLDYDTCVFDYESYLADYGYNHIDDKSFFERLKNFLHIPNLNFIESHFVSEDGLVYVEDLNIVTFSIDGKPIVASSDKNPHEMSDDDIMVLTDLKTKNEYTIAKDEGGSLIAVAGGMLWMLAFLLQFPKKRKKARRRLEKILEYYDEERIHKFIKKSIGISNIDSIDGFFVSPSSVKYTKSNEVSINLGRETIHSYYEVNLNKIGPNEVVTLIDINTKQEYSVCKAISGNAFYVVEGVPIKLLAYLMRVPYEKERSKTLLRMHMLNGCVSNKRKVR